VQDIVHTHNPGPFTELDPRYGDYDSRFRADPTTNVITLQLGSVWSHFQTRFTVNNLLNAHPVLHVYADAPGSALVYAYTIRPRTIGLSGDWRF
jgi:outer membrane receptor protein involved in Fe transport